MNAVAQGYDKVLENTFGTYVIRGDVNFTGTDGGYVQFKMNLGDSSTQSLGAGDAAGDVQWSDGTDVNGDGIADESADFYWVKQATKEVFLNETPVTATNSFPNADLTGPTIISFVFGGGANDNALTAGDTITITFSEPVDPTSLHPQLIPGGASVVPMNGATGDVFLNNEGVVTVANIASTDVVAFGPTSLTNYTSSMSLNAAGTVLTIVLQNPIGAGLLPGSEVFGDVIGVNTTVKDLFGNFLLDSFVTASGSI